MNHHSHLEESVSFIRKHWSRPLDTVVILGSGLGVFAEQLPHASIVPYNTIPHFPVSTVEGHAGNLVFSEHSSGHTIACMQGRFHFYEGYSMQEVVFPLRVLSRLGAKNLIVTNAAGGINPHFKAGQLMLITDQLNLMGDNPLRGENWQELGPRFPDLSAAYAPHLREIASQAAEKHQIHLAEGVYAAMRGPTYETPAEIRMLNTMGADAVGMSTAPEVIAANHMGMSVLGISCISNLAAGISDHPLSHQEVMDTAEAVKPQFIALLNEILHQLQTQGSLSATHVH